MKGSSIVFFIAVLCFSTMVGYGQERQSTAGENIITVEIKNFQFIPSQVTVKPGTTVKWINLDEIAHDVTSGVSLTGREARRKRKTQIPDNKFQSGLFGQNKTYTVTFEEKGEYPYYCNVHPFMTAKIVVE